MSRAVFLDRDGTINEDVGYIADPRCFELIPGAVAAMNRLRAAGFCLPLVTNQAGVGRRLNDRTTADLRAGRLSGTAAP